jgi:hypothetical protein
MFVSTSIDVQRDRRRDLGDQFQEPDSSLRSTLLCCQFELQFTVVTLVWHWVSCLQLQYGYAHFVKTSTRINSTQTQSRRFV